MRCGVTRRAAPRALGRGWAAPAGRHDFGGRGSEDGAAASAAARREGSPQSPGRRATVGRRDIVGGVPASSPWRVGTPAARLWPSATASAHNAPMSTFEIMGMVFGTAGLSLGTLGFIFSVTALRKISELEARLAKEAPGED